VSCHQYTAVRLDCFECHNPKTSVSLAQALLPGALNEAASRDFRTAVSQDEVHMASLALTSATTAHGVAARQP
jgi:hypothetical protein